MRIDPQFGKYVVFALSLAVFAAGLAREAFLLNVGAHTMLQDLRQFDLDAENSVPAWWGSSVMLLTCLVLYTLASRAWWDNDRLWRLWLVLAVAFLALSIDESASFHEGVIEPLRAAFGFTGILYYAWVVPALLCVAALGLLLLPLLKDLPKDLIIRFGLFGGIFLSGALGMEMVGGWLDYEGQRVTAYYALSTSVEEGLELLGLSLFLAALLDQFDPARAVVGRLSKDRSEHTRPGRQHIVTRPQPQLAAMTGQYPLENPADYPVAAAE